MSASFRFPSAANYLLLIPLKYVHADIALFGGGWSPVLSFGSITFGLGARGLRVFFSSADVGDFLSFDDCFALGDFDFFSSKTGALAFGFEDALGFEDGTFNSFPFDFGWDFDFGLLDGFELLREPLCI